MDVRKAKIRIRCIMIDRSMITLNRSILVMGSYI